MTIGRPVPAVPLAFARWQSIWWDVLLAALDCDRRVAALRVQWKAVHRMDRTPVMVAAIVGFVAQAGGMEALYARHYGDATLGAEAAA